MSGHVYFDGEAHRCHRCLARLDRRVPEHIRRRIEDFYAFETDDKSLVGGRYLVYFHAVELLGVWVEDAAGEVVRVCAGCVTETDVVHHDGRRGADVEEGG